MSVHRKTARTLVLALAAVLGTAATASATTFTFRVAAPGVKYTEPETPQIPPKQAANFVLNSDQATARVFSPTLVGTLASSNHYIGVTNIGDAAGSLELPAFEGPASADFGAAGCVDVDAGATCTVTVRFAPTAAGTRAASLMIAGSVHTFNGQGIAPAPNFLIEGSPNTNRSFPATAVGSTAVADVVVQLRNTGTAAGSLEIPSFRGADPGDFSASGCSNVVVNALCSVNVRFNPHAEGEKSAQLTLGGTVFSFTGTTRVYGDSVFTTPGTYYWTAPDGVTKVSVVAIGGGGSRRSNPGGGGGGLGYLNNIAVTPGTQYLVVVGAGGIPSSTRNGGASYFGSASLVSGAGGTAGGPNGGDAPGSGGGFTGEGGGAGGSGGSAQYAEGGGGGGAGGYAGRGGTGGRKGTSGYAGTGGAGGGGSGGGGSYNGGNGGGVDLYGLGNSGVGGVPPQYGVGGTGGNGSYVLGAYGGGASATPNGVDGALRIIWGPNRSFPDNAR